PICSVHRPATHRHLPSFPTRRSSDLSAEQAINSPLLESSMEGAKGVLLSVAGGSDLGLQEVNQAAIMVQEKADEDVNLIFGTIIDDNLGDEVRVTIIATGFDAEAN